MPNTLSAQPAPSDPSAPPAGSARSTRKSRAWPLALAAALALSGVAARAQPQGTPPAAAAEAAATAPDLASAAMARHQEAASVLALTTDGRLLVERDPIKLDGYGYCGQAIALAERGEFRQSIRAASKALYLGVEGSDEQLVAMALRDLAIAYSYAGWLTKAEEYARYVLQRPAQNPAQTFAPAHKILGDVAQRRGQPQEALGHYGRALEHASARFKPLVLVSMGNAYTAAGDPARALQQFDQIGGSERERIGAFYLRSRGNALRAAGRTDDALALYGQVAADTSQADADYQRLWANEGIARIRDARGERDAAFSAWLDAARLAESLRARFRSDELKTGLFGEVQQVFEQALRAAAARQDWATAWALSEAARGRQLLDSLRNRATDTLTARATLQEVQAILKPGEAVVEYHVLDDVTYVFQIEPGGIAGGALPFGEEDLRADVEGLRESIVKRRRTTQERAADLYKRLIPLGIENRQRLFVVPHGPLHYLPFQALHDGQRWVIERHAIAVWPSASVGVQLARRDTQAGGPQRQLLAFGNPATDRNVPLPGAEAEVKQISSLFPSKEVYFRSEATKDRFKSTARNAHVLHVAAHAEVDDVDAMFSRILFASQGDDPGLLEAREIYGLDLKGVDLVTLSACESGLGRIARGDEIMGFTRSFLSAGTDTVIASLWPVADDATQILMSRLYQEATAGADLMDALRAAQLEVLKNRRYTHPFFWAPFNAIGNGALHLARG